MGLRIRTNISSLVAQRRLGLSTNEIHESMAKLASGSRINKAADDAAGLAISENLKADIRSLNQAKRNALDGVSLVQTAEGGLEETSNILIRLRELAIQAASDTIGDVERSFVNKEYIALKDEIDRIASTTEFNGTRLLAGNRDLGPELSNKSDRFPLDIHVGKNFFEGADQSDSPVNIIKIDFSKMNVFTDGENSLNLGKGEEGTKVDTKESAQRSIATIDEAMKKISESRAYLGAIQNRLACTSRNLEVYTENISEANSRIRDTDYASETANYTQYNILQQAGASVLANANVQPQIALKLLQ